MDIKYRLYPHPVLWDKNDDYKNSGFDCNIEIRRDIKRFELKIKLNLDNNELKELIKNDKAEYVLHIESPATSYRKVVISNNEEINIFLADENLLGKVALCPFIVAKSDLSNYTNVDFNEDYEQASFDLQKGTILAISDKHILDVQKDNEDLAEVPSIFTVYKRETTEEMGMEVELNSEKIRIGLNIKDYESYCMFVRNTPNIVNSFIIFPALIYTFEQLKKDFEDYNEYRWFKAIEKMFKSYKKDLSEEIQNEKSSLELAQGLMMMPVSKALLEISQIDDANGGVEV